MDAETRIESADWDVVQIEVADGRRWAAPFDAPAMEHVITTVRERAAAIDPRIHVSERLAWHQPGAAPHSVTISMFDLSGDGSYVLEDDVILSLDGERLRSIELLDLARWGEPFDDVAAQAVIDYVRAALSRREHP